MSELLDIVIIGAGPIGLACALEAKAGGLSCLIIEKGCLVNSLFNYPVNMTFFSTSERLEIGNVPFVSNNPKPTRSEALEYYRRVAAASGVECNLFEEVLKIEKHYDTFTISTHKQTYKARNVVIATGFYNLPFLLNIPGETLSKVTHYYKDPHLYAFRKVLVIGANNSAVDAALETFRKGAEVTMVIRGSDIGKRVKYWVKPDIENRIAEGNIRAFFNSSVLEITNDAVIIEIPGGIVTLPNDHVIAMTGYQPDLAFLRDCGVRLSGDEVRKPFYDDDSHETNIPGLYLAGVICGGMNTHSLFIENSREHAGRIIQSVLQKNAV